MKKTILAFASFICLSVNAQERAYTPQTGDKELDNVLTDINTRAKADMETFQNDLEATLSLPKVKTQELLTKLSPADVYMAAQTAQTAVKPIDDVVAVFEKNKGKGWGVTAKELGIKPGSKEFKALKGKVKDKGKSQGKAKNAGKGKSDEKGNSETKTKGKPEDKGKGKK
jgi:hypothetical protein